MSEGKRHKRTLSNYSKLIRDIQDKSNEGSYEPSLPVVKREIEAINSYWKEYDEAFNKLQELSLTDQEEKLINDDWMEIIAIYNTTLAILEDLMSQREAERHLQPADPTTTQSRNPQVRLKKLDVPKFSGRVTEWISFWDIYNSLVHDNKSLSDVEKFQHLVQSLDDEPRDQIRSLSVTGDNYKVAIQLLEERYNNRRVIINERLKALFNLQPVSRETGRTLRSLLDTIMKETLALEAMGYSFKEPTANLMLTYMVLQKLDQETYKWWNMSQKTMDVPTWDELRVYLQTRCQDLESRDKQPGNQPKPNHKPHQQHNKPKAHAFTTTSKNSCILCPNESHFLFKCPKFNSMSIKERWSVVKKHRMCFNCFSTSHASSNCTSKFKCKTCNELHNTLLHEERQRVVQSTQVSAYTTRVISRVVFLPTAVVRVKDHNNKYVNCRVMLDQGSQLSIITEECVRMLGLKRQQSHISIVGIGDGECGVNGQVNIGLKSMFSNYNLNVEAVILPKVTGMQPTYNLNQNSLQAFKNLPLANPTYFRPDKIDILLGAAELALILRPGLVKSECGGIIAQDTEFGYIVSGTTEFSGGNQVPSYHTRPLSCHSAIESEIKRFLQIEEPPEEKQVHLTPEEKECEEHFASTHQRDESGRFIVRLPIRENGNQLGDSRSIAFRRLLATEKRLEKVPEKKPEYIEFLEEYESLGHMTNVTGKTGLVAAYLPHHFVEKEESTTTKLRVVFDGSCKTTSGKSLNDILKVGPKLQRDIVNILISFRFHQVAITGDLAKMFRQIKVHPNDRKYQHVLWRDQQTGQIQDFELNTVTYGTASASYLATKCLQQLAVDERSKFPMASATALDDTYMDDIVTGAQDDDKAVSLTNELINFFQAGCFKIRKFMSNSKKLMDSIPMELRGIQGEDIFGQQENYKMLGISWDFVQDQFVFKIPDFPFRPRVTKRSLSSDIARIFDPLGWLGPFIIKAKLLLQRVWSQDIGWDEPVSRETTGEWYEFFDQIQRIKCIQIPRCVMLSKATKFEIHGFSDASDYALCACIYIVSITGDDKRKSSLLVGKTKVAPMNQKSTPKLELSAAALLAQLLQSVVETVSHRQINHNVDFRLYAWSDSMNVLHWLNSEPRRWKTFVANRVAKVQSSIPTAKWGHVDTKENPADLGSRGLTIDELAVSNLWWQGPAWLQQGVPTGEASEPDMAIVEKERKKTFCLSVQIVEETMSLTNYSTLQRLLGVTAYLLRVLRKSKPKELVLSAQERANALNFWIRKVQSISYAQEIKRILKNEPIKSGIAAYSPFIDENGIIRVGGRLRNATHLQESVRHPIILPKESHLSLLLVRDSHWRNLHAGPTLLISTIRQRYHIVGLRSLATKVTRNCIVCARYNAKVLNPKMADLPSSRVTPSHAWEHTGCDFAGPLLVRTWKGRGFKTVKVWICVLICFSSKAVHLEVVSELSTNAFLAALERFVSIRGRPTHMHSDNGTNFVGAEKELHSYFSHPSVLEYFSKESITWHFSPPQGPHFGGLWEAAVKSFKKHLVKTMGASSYTYEEMTTALTKISCCLNSRPLYPISNDPTSFEVLTPGHFLIGKPLNSIPNPDVRHLKWNSMDRWQKLQQSVQRFWEIWSQNYLLELQRRGKWVNGVGKDAQVGDLVVVHDDNQPPAKWKMARITELIPGKDGEVRVVKLKSATGDMTRPVVKISILPVHEE